MTEMEMRPRKSIKKGYYIFRGQGKKTKYKRPKVSGCYLYPLDPLKCFQNSQPCNKKKVKVDLRYKNIKEICRRLSKKNFHRLATISCSSHINPSYLIFSKTKEIVQIML